MRVLIICLFVAVGLPTVNLHAQVRTIDDNRPVCRFAHATTLQHLRFDEADFADSHARIPKRSRPPEIGDEEPFNVQENGWSTLTFRLMDKTESYYLWMEVEEIAGLSEFDFSLLRRRLIEESHPNALISGGGIMPVNRQVFGELPDYDQDGILDILLYDIDGALGYVTAVDQRDDTPEGIGNQADIVYVATLEDEELTASIISHEMTHLIHFTTGADNIFVFEGVGEFSEVVNGYEWHPEISYWQNVRPIVLEEGPTDLFEYELPLFYWLLPEIRNYERSNHFFTYLGEQFGPELVGAVLQNEAPLKGGDGLNAALEARGSSLNEAMRDFHAANLFNDAAVSDRFVHRRSSRNYTIVPQRTAIDGETPSSTGPGTLYATIVDDGRIAPGATRYMEWSSVADFSFQFDTPGFESICSNPALASLCESRRNLLRGSMAALLTGFSADGEISVVEVYPGEGAVVLGGVFESVVLVLSHSDPDLFNPANWPAIDPQYTFTATWTPGSQVTDSEQIPEFTTRVSLSPVYPNPFVGSTSVAFGVATAGHVRLEAFGILGQRVATIMDAVMPPGQHSVSLEANEWPAGVYLITLQHSEGTATRLVHKAGR